MKLSVSTRVFWFLVFIYALCGIAYIFLPTLSPLPASSSALPAPKYIVAFVNFVLIFVIYGGLGFLGLQLSSKIGFRLLWDKKVSYKEKFITPALIGLALGIFLIIVDKLISPLTSFGSLPHPSFPTSLLASLSAAIGEEIIFRLFFISFWVWLISHIILKDKGKNFVFWLVTIWSALAFSAGHLPSVMALKSLTSPAQIPPLVLGEIFLLNSVVSIPAAYLFKKNGILAAMGIHFWTDIVWHVVYGLFFT